MNKEEIISLTCVKHIKIYKLKQLGLTNKEIATELSTNPGHVYNALKGYENNQDKIDKANAL